MISTNSLLYVFPFEVTITFNFPSDWFTVGKTKKSTSYLSPFCLILNVLVLEETFQPSGTSNFILPNTSFAPARTSTTTFCGISLEKISTLSFSLVVTLGKTSKGS